MGKILVHPIPKGGGIQWEKLVELPFDQSSGDTGSMDTAPIDPTGFDLLICELEIEASYSSGLSSSSYFTNISVAFMNWSLRINGSDEVKTRSDHVRVCLIKSNEVGKPREFRILNGEGMSVAIPERVGVTMGTPKGVSTAAGLLQIWGGKIEL